MQVKVAESVPKRHVSFEERYFIEPRAIMALDRTHGSSLKPLCLCEKKNVNFRFSYRCIASKEISAWKIPHLTCPNSECGEMKTYEASSSLGRPYFNFRCT